MPVLGAVRLSAPRTVRRGYRAGGSKMFVHFSSPAGPEQELAQKGGAESARVFGMGMDLEATLVGRLY